MDRPKQSGATKSRNYEALNSKGDRESELGFNPIAATLTPLAPRLGLAGQAFKAMGWLSLVVGLLRPCAIEADYKPWPITKAMGWSKLGRHQERLGQFYVTALSIFIFIFFFL
jgi:hypothetical protein